MPDYYEALLKCGQRYLSMLYDFVSDNHYWGWSQTSATYKDAEDLRKFILEFIQGCESHLPLMKLNRWLGFIQGSLIQWGVTDVETERNWTRPLFRPLDFPE